jgi:hypothetical protein
VFSIEEDLTQNDTVNFKDYAVFTDQQSPRRPAGAEW